MVERCYQEHLGEPGSEAAHELLHRHYETRRRINGIPLPLFGGDGRADDKLTVKVCVGTNCHVRGSQKILQRLLQHAKEANLTDVVDIQATFCFEACDKGPTITIGDREINRCTIEQAVQEVDAELSRKLAQA